MTPKILSVSHLTALVKNTLERAFPSVWVQGEIADLSRPQSGHMYLTLKDDHAQIRGVIWRSTAQQLLVEPADGLRVLCRGELDVYPPRGAYQLIIRQLEPLGVGALQQRLEKLRRRLTAEGLFDNALKRALPRFPRRIAVVTSPTGAAIRDFLEVVRRRWKGLRVVVAPTRVQGPGSAAEIARAIAAVNHMRPAPDVVVVTRGGGSLEDLWGFNEEAVVRAIHASHLPVVSAIGHEIDVTLADLAADVRALTPTEAAERVAPSEEEARNHLGSLRDRLVASLRNRASAARVRLDALAQTRAFRRPLDRVHELARRLDELQARAARAVHSRFESSRHQVRQSAGRLQSLSPLAVLARGYSLTEDEQGNLIQSAEQTHVGQVLVTRLHRGRAVSRVEETISEGSATDPSQPGAGPRGEKEKGL